MAMAKALGHVTAGQETALEALCQAAETELTRRLRPGVSPEDCGSAFVLACAWMALAGLTAGDWAWGTHRPASLDRLDALSVMQFNTQVWFPHLTDEPTL